MSVRLYERPWVDRRPEIASGVIGVKPQTSAGFILYPIVIIIYCVDYKYKITTFLRHLFKIFMATHLNIGHTMYATSLYNSNLYHQGR